MSIASTRLPLLCVVLVTACTDRSLDRGSMTADLAAVLDLAVPDVTQDFAVRHDFAVAYDLRPAQAPADLAQSIDCGTCSGSCEEVYGSYPACIGDGVCGDLEDCSNSVDCPGSASCEAIAGGYGAACIGDGVCGYLEDCANSADCPCSASCKAIGGGFGACIGDGVCGDLEDCSNSVDCSCSAACILGADNDPRLYICAGDGVCDHEDCHYSPADCPCPAGQTCKYGGGGYFDIWRCE